MASRSSSAADRISRYIREFGSSSSLTYSYCVKGSCPCYRLLKVSRRCVSCAGMSQKYEFPFWSVLERQKTELESRLKWEKILEKRAHQKALEHRARVQRLRRTIELNRSRLLAKTIDELEKQDREIEKRIAREGLTEKKKQDAADVASTEKDMEAFLQSFPSVGVFFTDFVLGSSSTA